jgi:hypothetical protein
MSGVLWSFYPSLNTVKCWKRTEGHRRNENSSERHKRKFKKNSYKEEVFFESHTSKISVKSIISNLDMTLFIIKNY